MYVDRVRRILNGDTVQLERVLQEEMGRLSDEWRFEEAQAVKERFEAVKRYNARSVIGAPETGELDMLRLR